VLAFQFLNFTCQAISVRRITVAAKFGTALPIRRQQKHASVEVIVTRPAGESIMHSVSRNRFTSNWAAVDSATRAACLLSIFRKPVDL
jgi:hypothetical protein